PPVIAAPDVAAGRSQSIAAASLFTVADPDGRAITAYQLTDGTSDPASGYFVVNGTAPTAPVIDVTAAELAQTVFQTGTVSDFLGVRAFDGFEWSAWSTFHVTMPANHAPVVVASDVAEGRSQSVAAASLFTVTDADHDTITA